MNHYGMRAQGHWKKWLPTRYANLGANPETFFAQMGEEISTRVQELAEALEGDDKPGEGYLEKVGRLNMARLVAEEQAMKEIALLQPENGEDDG